MVGCATISRTLTSWTVSTTRTYSQQASAPHAERLQHCRRLLAGEEEERWRGRERKVGEGTRPSTSIHPEVPDLHPVSPPFRQTKFSILHDRVFAKPSHVSTVRIPTLRLSDSPTLRLSDSPTLRLSDSPTLRLSPTLSDSHVQSVYRQKGIMRMPASDQFGKAHLGRVIDDKNRTVAVTKWYFEMGDWTAHVINKTGCKTMQDGREDIEYLNVWEGPPNMTCASLRSRCAQYYARRLRVHPRWTPDLRCGRELPVVMHDIGICVMPTR
jgi:hypothetical protein